MTICSTRRPQPSPYVPGSRARTIPASSMRSDCGTIRGSSCTVMPSPCPLWCGYEPPADSTTDAARSTSPARTPGRIEAFATSSALERGRVGMADDLQGLSERDRRARVTPVGPDAGHEVDEQQIRFLDPALTGWAAGVGRPGTGDEVGEHR